MTVYLVRTQTSKFLSSEANY